MFTSDAWNESYARAPSSSRASDISISFQIKNDDAKGDKSFPPEGEQADESPSGRSPFIFGTHSPGYGQSDESELPPLSRDPYAHYQAENHRAPLSSDADEEEYFFGAPPGDSSNAPAKPTSWEEIRRRAAERERK